MPALKQLWYEIEDEQEAGQAAVALAIKNRDLFSARKRKAAVGFAHYDGESLNSLSNTAYDGTQIFETDKDSELDGDDDDDCGRQTHNLGARIMDAIDAKIFNLEKTKTQFVMSEGGWKVRSSGIKAARFIEGQQQEPQGMFPDLWAVWRHGARLATVATTAAMVFFWSDPSQGKIVAELDDTLNVFVETTGLPYDGYSSIGRVTYWDPEKLAQRYPKHAKAIKAAAIDTNQQQEWRAVYCEEDLNLEDSNALRVPLIQAWRMRIGDPEKGNGVEGKEIACIPNLTLERKDYPYDYPPCERFCPMPALNGKWGKTILERAIPAIERYNQILNSCDSAERLTPKGVVFYDPTSSDPELLKQVKNVVLIPHTGPMDKKPIYEPPPPFHPIILELLDLHKNAAYDLTGMNEAHATMNIGKGMSGVAIRLVKQEIYEMFSALEDELQRCMGPGSARQIMRCARELQKAGGFTSIWKGGSKGGWLEEISADVFDVLEDQKYRTSAQPVSGEQNTPANRVELAQELVQVGIITGEAWAQVLQDFNTFGHSGNELSSAEEEFIEKQIDSWLFADVELAKKRTIAPEIWMDKDLSMTLKVGAAYLRARMDMINDMDDPEVTQRLEFFRTFMSQLSANQQKRMMLAQQAQQAAQPQQQPQPPVAA